MWLSSRCIIGDSYIEPDAKIGIDMTCCVHGTSQSDFLLYGKRGIQIEWKRIVFERLQYFDEDIYRKAVIERLAIYTIAHLNKIAFTCNGIPHTDNFFQLIYRISCIDKIVANLRHPVAFFRSHEVNGFATHDT